MNKLFQLNWWKAFFVSLGFLPFACPIIYYELQSKAYLFKLMVVAPFASVALLVLLVFLWRKKEHFNFHRINLLLFAFIAWMSLSLIWSENVIEGLKTLSPWIFAFFLALISGHLLIKDSSRIDFLLKTFIIAGFGIALFGIWEHLGFQSIYMVAAPPSASFGNRNMAGQFILLSFPFAIHGLLNKSRFWRYTSLFAVFAMGIFIMAIRSRAVFLGFIVEMIIIAALFLLAFRKSGFPVPIRLKPIIVSIVLVAVSYTLITVPTQKKDKGVMGLKERLEYTIKEAKGKGAYGYNERIPTWLNTFEMVKDYPIIGAGVGQWKVKFPLYNNLKAKDWLYDEQFVLTRLHNDFLEYWATLGFIGLVLLFLPGVGSLLLVARLWHKSSAHHATLSVCAATICGIGVSAITSFPLQNIIPILWVMLILQIIAALGVKESLLWSRRQLIPSWGAFVACIALLVPLPYTAYAHYRIVKSNALHFKGDYLKNKHPQRNHPQMRPMIDKLYRGAYEYDPSDNVAIMRHFYYSSVMGRHERSVKVARAGLKYFPYDKLIQRALFEIYMSKWDFAGMRDLAQRLQKDNPRYFFSHIAVGHVLWFGGQRDQALGYYEKGLEMAGGKELFIPNEVRKIMQQRFSNRRKALEAQIKKESN